MRTLLFYTVLLCLLGACGTGMKYSNGKRVKKEEIDPIRPGFSGIFSNTIYLKETGENSTMQVLWLFDIFDSRDSFIQISVDNSSVLHVTYRDTLSTVFQTKNFQGKMASRGYYEVFVRRIKKEFPPVLPIVYGFNDIDRLRIALNRKGALMIENKQDRSGNIFLFSAGGGSRTLYFIRRAE